MIGTELLRAKSSINLNMKEEVDSAYMRAFELIDLTVADPRWKKKCKELLILKETMAGWYFTGTIDATTNASAYKALMSQSLEAYKMVGNQY